MPASIELPAGADKHRIPIDANKIKSLRTSLGLSQVQAAKLARLSSSQIWSDVEKGRRSNLTIETLDRIAAALGVKAKDLLK